MSFYVVLKGRKPGVYTSWHECFVQVNGFKGACYFKCQDYVEAMSYFNSKVKVEQSEVKEKTTVKRGCLTMKITRPLPRL